MPNKELEQKVIELEDNIKDLSTRLEEKSTEIEDFMNQIDPNNLLTPLLDISSKKTITNTVTNDLTGKLQYSENTDYTSTQTVTITTEFTPKEIHFNGYLYKDDTYDIFGTTTGFAGITDPTSGKNNYFTIQGTAVLGAFDVSIGTGDNLGGNSTCYCYVSEWNDDNIVLEVVCPTDWTLSTNLLIKG